MTLEQQCQMLNGNISALQTLVSAVLGRDCVVSVSDLSDGTGYSITFASGRTVTLRNGRTKYGKDGADVKEFSQTIHHEVGGHEFVKLLGAILLFWKHSIMRFKTFFVQRFDY